MIGPRKSLTSSLLLVPWILAPLLLAGVVLQTHKLDGVTEQLEDLRAAAARAERHQRSLTDGLGSLAAGQRELGSDLVALETGLDAVQAEAVRAEALTRRLAETEGRLGMIGEVVEAQAGNLEVLAEAQAAFGPADLSAALELRDARLREQYETLDDLARRAAAKADENRRLAESLGAELHAPRDLQGMWRELVGPVVQLAGEESVGSGVLLQSRAVGEEGPYSTYLLTAWHVVRDIQGSPAHRDRPVPVTIYGEDGTTRHEEATLLCHDTGVDAALLEITTDEAIPNGARLPQREELASVRIFDEVYAVGCPLGNDPIPTRGEISTNNHVVDDESYWMINAPTYIGNSGGGIFHSDTHALLGIFSKIYTHGSVRPTIVPHMGLAVPLETIYDWLAEEGYEVVEPEGEASPVLTAMAK